MRLETQESPSSNMKKQSKQHQQKKKQKKTRMNESDDEQTIMILCDTCSTNIGRMYRGDDEASSTVKDAFSFRLDAVERYYFGSGDLRVIPPPESPEDDDENTEDEDIHTHDVGRIKKDLDDVKKTVGKLQQELSLHRKKLAQYDALLSNAG